eukprot:604728-Amphidinium_carterae.1
MWRAGGQPPVQLTTRDLGVDTQSSAWKNPVREKGSSCVRTDYACQGPYSQVAAWALAEVGGMT